MKQRGKYQNSTHFISQSSETCNSSLDIYSQAGVDTTEEALRQGSYAELEAEIQNLMARKIEEEGKSVKVCQLETLRVDQCADCIEIHAMVLTKEEIQEMKRLRQENRWLRTRNQELQTQLQAVQLRIRNTEDISENNDHLSHQLYLRIKQLQHQRKEIQELQLGMHHQRTIIQQLQQEVDTNQSVIENLLEKLRQPQEKLIVIKQVPVYIEKDVLIEVAVPIYINQKRQEKNYNLLTINQSIFQSENSISMAINELSAQMEPSEANSDTRKSNNFKFGNSKSFQASDIYEEEKSFTGSKNPREKRIKQIVEVPVYIEKEVIKEVEKEVIVEREVIKYVYAQDSQISQNEEGEVRQHALTWHGHSAFADFMHIEEESMESKESLKEQHSARDVWNRHASIAQRVQESQNSMQGHSQKEIIIQIPVQVEKEVIVFKEILVPFEVPTEIILQRQTIIEKIVQKEIPVEKIVYVDRQVVVEKEIIVEKEVIVQKQVIVEKIIQKIVPHQIIIQKVVGLDVGKTKTHRNTRVEPNLPEDITLHFDLQENMTINKILVTQEGASSQYLQKSMMMREFVSRELVGEKVRVEYVELPVQIILDQRGEGKDVEVQVDLGEKPMEIIVEKVIYLNERYRDNEERDDLEITLGKERPRSQENDGKDGQIIVEKIIEVEVEKIVEKIVQVQIIKYQTIPLEIPTQIFIEKFIQVPKQIYIERPFIIYQQLFQPLYLQPPQQPQTQRHPQEQIRISQGTQDGLNLCIPLTDRSQSSAHQKQEHSPYKNYDHFQEYEGERELYQIKEISNHREEQYQEDYERWQEEIRCTQDRLIEIGQENQALTAEIKKLRVQNNSLHTTINEMSSAFEITIIRERQNMHEIIEEEIKKREMAEAQAEDFEKLAQHLKEQLHFEKNNVSYMQVRMKNQQKSHQNQQKELLRQIQLKNQQIQQLFQAHQQQLKHSKYYEQRLIQQKSMIQSQLTEIRNELQMKSTIQQENKELFQEKFMELLRHHQEMKCEYQQKIQTIELLYKKEIDQLVAKNQENVNQKKTEIAELQKTIRGIQMRQNRAKNSPSIERNNQKINVKIINLQNQAKKGNGIRQGFQTKGEEELYEENQRFLEVIENLNDQIGKLNERINLLQQGSRNDSGHLETRSKIKSFYFNQFQPQKITEKIPKTRIRIQQLGQTAKGNTLPQPNDSLSSQLLNKNAQIQRFKELINSYEQVIEDLQGQLISIHQQDHQRSSYYAEPTPQVKNWTKKIILLQQQLKFQKSQKLKANIRIRDYERMIAEFNYNQAYSDDDTELIERLMHQLQQEKIKTMQLRKENQRLKIQVKRQEGEIMELHQECTSARKARDNLLLDQLQEIDRKFQGEFGYDISTLKKYQNYKLKYIKILELSQLIKEQLTAIQPKLPKSCEQSLNRIHRFLTIIQNNQKNSSSPPRPSKSRSHALQQRDQDLLYSQLLSLAS